MSEDLKKTISEASNSYQQLLEKTHTEALARNESQTKRWQDYKREHKELSERLLSLRDKLSHTIMVPLGNKALMRGKLVHTNEILVCLGDGWFVKQTAQQAAEMCQRRVKQCDEALEKLQKEEELLSSRKSLPFKTDAFGGDHQAQELIEAYDEEAEKLWRERHRQKQKEYHQKLAEIRASQTKKIESEEDIWSRLDALDIQEELEDELNRMDGSSETEDDLEESEDESDSSGDQEGDKNQTEEGQDKNTKSLTRRVSFKKDKEEETISEENNEELILINFKHSNTPSYVPSGQEPEIRSPADIYSQYVRQRVPKSILKRTTSIEPLLPEDPKPSQLEDIMKPEEPIVKVIGDEVVERTTTVPSVVPCERPVSRFKAARMASKR